MLCLLAFERGDDRILGFGAPSRILHYRIDQCRQFCGGEFAARDVGMADEAGFGSHRAPRDGHFPQVEGRSTAAGPPANHDQAGFGTAQPGVGWQVATLGQPSLDLAGGCPGQDGHPAAAARGRMTVVGVIVRGAVVHDHVIV